MAELINGLGGEQGFGENFLDRNDDESTEAIDITSVFDGPLNFFGNEFEELWVNNNGNITFNDSLSQFTPDGITSETNNPLITPYWADVDTSSSEELDPTPGGNSIGSNLVYYDLDEANNTFTATWDDVGYFSSNTDKLNAFQLQLIGQGNGDFDIVFRYEDINWTTGNASGGENGLGGEVARGGFSAGDGENFFELSQSGNEQAMLNLEETTGNTGETGLFRFEVRNGESNVSPVLTTSSIGVEEGDSGVTEATFAVELLEAIEEEVTVDYATTGGTATAGEDYEETTGTLTFAAGETAKTITISVNGDEEIEPNEDVILELSNLSDNAEFPFDNDTFSKILTIQDDEIIPNPPTRGNNWGDPHLVTFDGNSYDFQAVGEFILTQSNNSDFEVQVRQEPLEDRDDVSINTAVATQLGEETVGLYTNREQPLVIDDTETELADGESLELGNGEIFRTNENRYTVVNADEDGEVNAGDSQLVATVYDNHIDVEVYIADVNQGGTTGLLGNFNGDPSDDLAIRDGETLEQPIPFEQLYGEYADSWRISQEESLFSYLEGNSTETFTNTDFPSRAITIDDLSEEERTAAEQVVDEAGITDPNLREAAILDVALSGDETFAMGASQSQIAQAEVEVEDIVGDNLQSDINEDGIVNLDDLGVFASAFASSEGSENFNVAVDFNADGLINLDDLEIFTSEFGS